MPEGSESPEPKKVVAFDRLFSSLASVLPNIIWQVIMQAMGRGEEQPSASALKQMKAGWETFFEACGVEYVGEGFHMRLKSPLWLILIPVVATLGAVASELGLGALVNPKKEVKQNEQAKASEEANPD